MKETDGTTGSGKYTVGGKWENRHAFLQPDHSEKKQGREVIVDRVTSHHDGKKTVSTLDGDDIPSKKGN